MKKYFIFAAVAAVVMSASCAKNETTFKTYADDAVLFGAYSGRTITKAGSTDDMNLAALKDSTAGFGVFATYTGTDLFENTSLPGATNDFMYNEKITWNGTEWTYAPVKYWPNPTNGQNADAQRVSFFAYAPYADPTATAADNSYGIIGFSTALAADDPSNPASPQHKHNFVSYKFSKNKPNVDLMWGYKTKTVDNTDPSNPVVTYTINNNLTRTLDKVRFVFQHLLSKLGGSQEGDITDPDDPAYQANGLVVKANPVSIDPTNGFGADNGTKITISRIVVASAPETEGSPAAAVTDIEDIPISYATGDQTGKLDLYTGVFTLDTTPAQAIQFSQTLSNNPADVTAGTADSEISDRLKEPLTAITDFAADLPKGVTEKAVNVYKDESNPIILIPGTKPVVDVTLTYIVRTYDEKLPVGYSEVPQTVWGRIKFPVIEKNKKYNIVMIIGLNDVKFEAEVEDWATGTYQVWVDEDNDGVVDPGEMKDGLEIGLPRNL
jgi:hypothetical protein